MATTGKRYAQRMQDKSLVRIIDTRTAELLRSMITGATTAPKKGSPNLKVCGTRSSA